MKNILFLEEQFSLQGTTRALIDYAFFNEALLNNRSFLAFNKKTEKYPWNEGYYKQYLNQTLDSLKKKFLVIEYRNWSELESFVVKNKIDVLYNIKSGEPTGVVSKNCKNVYHAVFPQWMANVHGDRYAYVSKWLSDTFSNGKIPYVPHIINVPKIDQEASRKRLREHYNIPKDAFVYGRIGGYNDFDLPFVYSAILKNLKKRKDVYYFFICTKPFAQHERIIYVDPILDLKQKYEHISLCDAMIHARHYGETFGLAIAEFCALNKPIITWNFGVGQGYKEILKDDAFYYNNENDLLYILNNFKIDLEKDYNSYKIFSPQNVIKKFDNVFLKNL
jgi:hypothetical protein